MRRSRYRANSQVREIAAPNAAVPCTLSVNQVFRARKLRDKSGPKLHGQGLGKILLSQGMERLRALGHQRCYLVTQFWRQVAIKLYLQFGFNPELSSDEEASAWKETYAAISGNSIVP